MNQEGEQHPYYITAKRIFHYSKFMKDVKGENWPIIGICQGIEVISLILSEDEPDALSKVFIYGENRPVQWTVNPQTQSKMFHTFPRNLTDRMESQAYVNHEHSYSITLETFNKTPGLNQMMKVTSIDKLDNLTFIDTMESKNYSIYASMYHPEY